LHRASTPPKMGRFGQPREVFPMPTSDLDMPLLPSAEQIRRREFATVRRGYDPQQVRTYLTSIANQVETLERELSQLRLEAGSAAARAEQPTAASAPMASEAEDPYEVLSKRFASLIEIADQEADGILQTAKADASRALEEARSEADRIRVDAQAHAEEARQEGSDLLERARLESDRILSGLAERRRGLVGQLEEMRANLMAVAEGLSAPLAEAAKAEVEDADIQPADEPHDPNADDPVDPRYEDLWVNKDEAVDIPDLASMDLDFDVRDE
jgi:DivIVA domain-containing protein